MVYCRNCGADLDDSTIICPKCGVTQNKKPPTTDYGGFGWTLLGCCIPIVGLILYLVWKDSRPVTARAAGTGAVVSIVVAVLWYFFTAVLGLGTALF